MKNLTLFQKIAVYTGLVSALAFGGYRCGPDVVEPEQDAQEETDAGNSKDYGNVKDTGNLEDRVTIEDTFDGGSNDVPNGDYEPADSDLTDTYVPTDGGDLTDVSYVDGGDLNVSDGGQGVPPVVVIETKDEQGNVKSEFNVNELIRIDASQSYDPDCSQKNKCAESKGISYCDWKDDRGGAGSIYFPPLANGISGGVGYTKSGTLKYDVTCKDIDDNLSTTVSKEITIK